MTEERRTGPWDPDVTAVVVAGSRPSGVDVLAPVGGVSMLARSVRCLLDAGLVDTVAVLDAGDREDALLRACDGLPVSVHGELRHALNPVRTHAPQRARPTIGDGPRWPGEVILLHDAARPLAPPALAVAVVDAVRCGHDAAVPVLPLTDTVKLVDGDGLLRGAPDRCGLRVVQTPHALRRGPDLDGSADPLSVALARAARGGSVEGVPGDPAAFAVVNAWDLELAELLACRIGP